MTERGTKAVFDSIDDLFKSKIPTSKNVLSKMRDVYTVRPYIQGKAITAGKIPIGTTSTHINIPTGGLDEAIQSGVGRMAQGVPSGGGAGGGGLDSITKLLGGAGQVAQRVGPQLGGQLTGQLTGQSQQEPIQQPQMQQQGQVTDQDLQAIKLAMAEAIMSGQISASEAEAILGLLGIGGIGGEGDLTKDQSKSVALQGSLDKLRQAWGGTGSGGKLMETLGLNIGTNARSLDQAKAAVVEDLGRLQSQGAINKDEKVSFESMMPNSWDSEQVVEQKLQAIQDRINAYL